jgi:hypothetical protein
VWAKTLVTAFKGTVHERYPGRTTARISGEQEVNINGKGFYQALVNWHFLPTEGAQMTGRWHLYLLRTEQFTYNLGVVTVLGYDEQQQSIFDKLARNLGYIE